MAPPDLLLCHCPSCSEYTVTRRGESVRGRIWRRAPYKAHLKARESERLALSSGLESYPSTSCHHFEPGPATSSLNISNLSITPPSQRHLQGTHHAHGKNERRGNAGASF